MKPLVNVSVTVVVVWAVLTFSGSIVSKFETSPNFALHRLEAIGAYGLLLVLAACTLAIEFKRSKDLDAWAAFRSHLKIAVMGLVVAIAVWIAGTVRAEVQDWQRHQQEQQRQKQEQEKRQQEQDRLKREREVDARKAECEADRKREIGRLSQRKTDAHAALVGCTEDERQKKSGEANIHQRCWTEWNAFNTGERQLKSVQARRCDGGPDQK